MKSTLGIMVQPNRDKVFEDMSEGEKKSANLLMDCMDLKAEKLGMEWRCRYRELLNDDDMERERDLTDLQKYYDNFTKSGIPKKYV